MLELNRAASVLLLVAGVHAGGSIEALVIQPAIPAAAPPAKQLEALQPQTGLSGQLDLVRLIDLASERLGLRIDYDPKVITGTVTLRDKQGLKNEELWAFLNEQLAARELTTVRTVESGGLSVVKLAAAAQSTRAARAASVPELHRELGSRPWPGFVVVHASARNRKATSIIKGLQAGGGKSGSTSITQLAETDVIVIADLRARVEDILILLELLDQPTDAVVEEYAAKYLTPSALVSQAKELVGKRDSVTGEKTAGELVALSGKPGIQIVAPAGSIEGWRSLLAKLDQAGTLVETRTYTPKVFPAREVAKLLEQVAKDAPVASTTPLGERTPGTQPASGQAADTWRMVIDELTGSLIITTTAAQHAKVAELLERLDSMPGDSSQQVRSFPIRNRPVKEVADALTQLLDPTGGELELEPAARRTASSNPSSSSGPLPLPDRPAQPKPVGDKQQTSKLRITVDEGLNSLITVGEPRTLAQVETLLATLDVRQPQVMVEVVLVSLSDGESLALGVELQKLGSLSDSAVQLSSIFNSSAGGGPATGPGVGFTGVVLNPGDFTAVVRAFEAINDGRSTSIPRVLVGNNQEATFSSVAQQPTSTISRDTTSTTVTGFGGFQDAGTKISIKPQIAEGDRLVLTYNIELSSFTGTASAGLPAPKQQNSVQSIATIPDGHTVVVGGLELTTETNDESRVPILGGIPLLGELFKNRSQTRDRTRFFVFIRANVMRDAGFEDLKYLSQTTAERNGLEVGEDWPKVEPRVIK